MINDDQHVTPTVIVTSGASLTQYTCPQIISWDPISLGFLVYIDAVCRL